ncbi:hypothetical protein MNBD_NITROSPINAE02-1829 [hydrothermal vent metagenome]|uniref:ABC-2 type transport system permease protein n=1 Tax=hydrothermal vent metagenome TaxID=652676 RepID=A0A3B1CC85_9ZZZZ
MTFSCFFALVKLRFRFACNSVFRSDQKSRSRFPILLILGIGFMAGDYYFFRRMLIYFNELPANVGEILIIQLLNLLCLTLFSMLIFSNVIASLSTLYLSRDLDLLISSPIPIRTAFMFKFLHTLVNSSWMALIFGIPIFAAYGNVLYAPAIYYFAIPVLLIPFLLASSSIGIAITMTLMRFFPARKTHQVLTFVGLIFVAGIVMYLRFLQPEKFIGQDVPEEMIIDFVEKMKAPDYPWLPSSMLSGALQAGVFSEWNRFYSKFSLIWGAGLSLWLLVMSLATWVYYGGWASSYGSRQTSLPENERLFYKAARLLASVSTAQAKALVMKDIKLFFRDTAQWSQLFMLGALMVVYIFNVQNLPLDTVWLKNIVSIMNIGLAGVVLAAVAARFVYASTSMEGKCIWTIHSAPVDFTSFLWVKFFLYLFPLLLLAETLVIVSNIFLGVDGYVMAVSAGTIAAITVGIVGMGVGMGALYPKFDFENVAEVATTSGAIIYMMGSMAYIGLSISIISRPVYIHLRNLFLGSGLSEEYNWIYFGALGALTFAMVFIPMTRGAAALKRLET